MRIKQYVQYVAFVLFCLCITTFYAQNSNHPKTITKTYYLQNATVIPKPGSLFQNTDILIENGIIKQIGNNIDIPFNAKVIPADSLYVYAGFIDTASHTGITTPSDSKEQLKIDNPGNPPNNISGITPYVNAFTLLDTSSKSIETMRENGFTLSHSIPQGGMLTGTGILISNIPEAENTVIKQHTAMMAQFKPASRMYPSTVIGIIAKWKDLYKQAENTINYQSEYNKNPNGKVRPTTDNVINAIIPVVKKQLPVFFETQKVLDVQRAIKLSEDLGFSLVLTEVKQIYPIIETIKQKNIPLLLSIDLPKEKKESKKNTENNTEETVLEKRKQEVLNLYLQQAALLEKENIPFAFSFLNSNVKSFKKNILRLIENGLSEKAALAALTTIPANILGVEQIAGTIESGKLANLVITQKPYFNKDSHIKYVFTEGILNTYEIKPNKKSNTENSNSDIIIGKWTFKIDTPDQTVSGTLIISNDNELQITFITTDQPNKENTGENIVFNENNLSFDAEVDNNGELLQIGFSLDFDDNRFKGNITAGNHGTFPIEGKKNNPEN